MITFSDLFVIVKPETLINLEVQDTFHILEQERFYSWGFDSIGLDQSKFGLHSPRSGGATDAAEAGIEDRLFKIHGRWKGEKAKDSYLKESIDKRLSVSKHIGL